ncbi:YdcF family protein [Eubacterium sp.]|uniref:YdcF family protein n=1 Tax=Eubacterium sp. TaxID=142586 RepID=UPI003F047631
MKAVVIGIGVVIIAIYFSPLFKSKVNIGNIFGISLGASIIAVSVFFEKIVYLFSFTLGKIIICFALVIISIFFIAFLITLIKIISNSRLSATDESVIIVLGCRVKGKTPTKALYSRCLSASKFLKANPSAKAILSGGQGKDEHISEAECMYRIMTFLGTDESRLIKEEKSTSTYENLLFSKEFTDTNRIAIATSEYHIYRAKLIANELGFSASGIPAKSIPVLRVSYFTREVFGIWYLKIKKALG